MDLIFNELSTQPIAKNRTEGLKRIHALIKTFKRANEFNFNKIRFQEAIDLITLSDNYTIMPWTLWRQISRINSYSSHSPFFA